MIDPKFRLIKTKLSELADQLDACPRVGADKDEPEGTRYIHMSDTLAREIAAVLRSVVSGKEAPAPQRCMLCFKPLPAGKDAPAAYICEDCQPK